MSRVWGLISSCLYDVVSGWTGTSEVGVRPDYIWFGNLCWAALGVYSPALLTVCWVSVWTFLQS